MILNSIPDLGCPDWAAENCLLLTRMGSFAYGVNTQSADHDIVGVVMPPLVQVFPQLTGHIPGFDPEPSFFTHWSRHHVHHDGAQYDVTLHGLVRYVQLLSRGTIGIIEPLFAPDRCVLHTTRVGDLLRAHRTSFLHKSGMRWLRHYAAGQIKKIERTTEKASPARQELIRKFGYDVKDASHIVRLYLQAGQILREGDLTLDANAQIMRDIRAGNWTLKDLTEWVASYERETLVPLLNTMPLREEPGEEVRDLLKMILVEHFGTHTFEFRMA